MTEQHHFAFSRNWRGHDRLCGECRCTYDEGSHIEITRLRPYTSYVCPVGAGLGHSSMWTGAYAPVNRSLRDHLCVCGAEFIEEDKERWLLTWDMQREDGQWRPAERIGTARSTQTQLDGLGSIPEVRNVRRARLVEADQ